MVSKPIDINRKSNRMIITYEKGHSVNQLYNRIKYETLCKTIALYHQKHTGEQHRKLQRKIVKQMRN